MKTYLLVPFLCFVNLLFAQKECEYAAEINDSIGTLKTTKEYLMFEKKFGNNENYIFFTLSNENGVPYLSFQNIRKNSEFISAICLDEGSKIHLQLENGKIVTLIHTQTESCGTLIREEETNKNIRILGGNFLFLKGSFEDLKSSPISLMRIKFATETVDFVIKKELNSELLKEVFKPESYFIEYLHCIE